MMTRNVLNALIRAQDAVLSWLHFVPCIIGLSLLFAGVAILWLEGII